MTVSKNTRLSQRDLSVLWHPCTQMHDHQNFPLIPIKSGKGVWLEDFEGRRYLDAISSWWVNLFGHANPTINAAVKAQLDSLEHVIFAGFTHEVGIALAEKLVDITPEGLTRCFYADNGSSSVEVALKMSFHYWQNKGKAQKKRFVTLKNSYHGETLGALAAGDVALYKQTYATLLMDVITVPSPDAFFCEENESWADCAIRQFAFLDTLLQQQNEEICAVIVEPLVQCAGGMRMYDPVYLSLLRAACDRYQVHLIADEIAVGFGRTGSLFACEQASISPDFMCVSKGLTGGYLPLAAVLTTAPIYDAFYDDYTKLNAFLHSHSYTGNPLACAAALATISLFDQDNVLENNHHIAQRMQQLSARFKMHPNILDVRQTGMIVALELVKNKASKQPFPWQDRRGLQIHRYALSKGVLLRPLGDIVYFMPPYVINAEELALMFDVAWSAIEWVTAH